MTETAITRNNLLDSLRRMAPGFQINPDLKEDSLGYPIVNDLARYICDQAGLDEFDKVRNGLEFLEVGLKLGDSYVTISFMRVWKPCSHVSAST
jgi:hypothetical protein